MVRANSVSRSTLALSLLLAAACGAPPGPSLVHLADPGSEASLRSASSPASAGSGMEWDFTEPRPEWRLYSGADLPRLASATLSPQPDGVRLTLGRPLEREGPIGIAGLATELAPTPLNGWTSVLVRARSHERLGGLAIAYNLGGSETIPDDDIYFSGTDEVALVYSDGSVQTYSLPLRPRPGESPDAQLTSLAVFAGSPAPAGIDILSIALVPRGAAFREDTGVRPVARAAVARNTLFAHAPAAIGWPLTGPDKGRLDFGLSCLAGETVTYRVKAASGQAAPKTLFEESVSGCDDWSQRSVDLSAFDRKQVTLSLEAESEQPGATALWGAPIVSGREKPGRASRDGAPNVLFYVIDGAGADLMSLYGCPEKTTPFLEKLAGDGVVFDHAYSNASWTQPSTASFMTSLHHSVLGGLRRGMHSTPVPPRAVTMAEHMRRGGYETGAFTSNPNCARMIGLDRGVDQMHDAETEHHSTSSEELRARFRNFRSQYPGSPWWVHIQTTDVHEPNRPVPPFAGMFAGEGAAEQMDAWGDRMYAAGGRFFGTVGIEEFYHLALDAAGLDRHAYFAKRRALYEETMAFQDRELSRFVEELKTTGEWDNTLLIIAADHGHPAGTFARFGRGLAEPQPAPWEGALFDAWNTHVPLIFVWPAKIKGGVRIAQPVSMIDILPTILDLAGLPPAEIAQGRSLAPLLRGGSLAEQPVVFDEFRVDEKTGEMIGNLEIRDGRWGASLEIGPGPGRLEIGPGPGGPDHGEPPRGRHAVPAGGRWGAVHTFYPDVPRLLLYDLEADPFALKAVNEAHPDLVTRYEAKLREIWEGHQALARHFHSEVADVPLTPEQLEQLKALGYIQ